MNKHSFTDPKSIEQFITAGKAIVTLESEKTGAHLTYRISKTEDGNAFFVNLLTGPQNTSDYTYLGMLAGKPEDRHLKLTAKSKMKADSRPVLAFAYVWDRVFAGKMPAQAVVRHEGKCGCCGRALTVSASIDRGIGPECAKKVGVA